MYSYPPHASVGRPVVRVKTRIPYPYPLRVHRDAPIEVEDLQPHSVRIRVPFYAPPGARGLPRVPQSAAGRWLTDNNTQFDIFFTLPVQTLATRDSRVEHLLVMFNGLNEIMPQHSQLYDWIGSSLAPRGVATVLFPTPYHLNRTPMSPTARASLGALLKKPTDTRNVSAPFLNFYRTLTEMDAFFRTLRTHSYQHLGFYNRFDERTRISLFGFSMGGLRALATFLLDTDHRFDKCILLCSGSALSALSPPDVDADVWGQFVAEVQNATVAELASCRVIPSRQVARLHSDLWGVFFDDRMGSLADELRKRAPSIKVIVGTADTPVSDGARKRLGTVCNIETIPGMGHLAAADPFFEMRFTDVVDEIARFVRSSHRPMPRTKYDIRDALLAKVRTVVPKKESLTPSRLIELAHKRPEVADLMLMSKARYASDAVLVDHIQRRWARRQRSAVKTASPKERLLSGAKRKLALHGVRFAIDKRSEIVFRSLGSEGLPATRRRLEQLAMDAKETGQRQEIRVGRAVIACEVERQGRRVVAVRFEAAPSNPAGHP